MGKLDGRRIFLSLDVIGYPIHGARAVQSDQCDNLIHIGYGHLPAKPAHPFRLQLKDTNSSGLIKQFESGLILKRGTGYTKAFHAFLFSYMGLRLGNDCERF